MVRVKEKREENQWSLSTFHSNYFLIKSSRTTSFRTIPVDSFQKIYKVEPEVLGSGAFGKVFKGYLRKNPKIKVAIKVLEKQKLSKHISLIKNEWQILKGLDHPNIINFLGVFESQESVYIVTELWEGKDLFQIYCKKKKVMSEYNAAMLLKTLIKAMIHCHTNGIIHRDLKLENIMFKNDDETNYADIRIIDFGLAAKLSKTAGVLSSVVGSPYFTAPEVFEEKYDEKWDVWSLGVVLYVLLGGDYPYNADTVSLLYDTIQAEEVEFPFKNWGNFSFEVKDLLSRMLDRIPGARISLEDWLKHKWFKKVEKENPHTPESEGSEKEDYGEVLDSLMKYNSLTILKREAMSVFIQHLNNKEIGKLNKIFQEFDEDNTGMITPKEIKKALKKIGKKASAEEIKKIIDNVDYLGNGKINYSEFLIATVKAKDVLSKSNVDNNLLTGVVLQDDGSNADHQLSENEIEEMFEGMT